MRAVDVDFAILPEVMTEVREHLSELEHDLHKLVQAPTNNDLLSSAFRHMHTIKGDFGYCHAEAIMQFVHQLEGVLQALRERRFQCSALIAEGLIQSMDQIQDMMETLSTTREYDQIPRDGLETQIRELAQATTQEHADQAARHMLLALHENGIAPPATKPAMPDSIVRARNLGQQLAAALESRLPIWDGRRAFQLEWVRLLNTHYLHPVDVDALELAVLWHDVSLLALPDTMLQRAPLPKSAEWAVYAEHPERSAAWLLSMAPDCTETAHIIRQHHVGVDGRGIPAPAYELPPHPGALMLGCADLLWEQVAGLSGEDFRRGVLRALFEINGGLETRVDAATINAFDAAARKMLGRTS
jgi:response regulator RpfG family c-di-GMP phosphodiesterase